ncbi:YndB with AHSA1/START domain [Ensifer sp. WSM1721]|uniref:SRPBCC family protein n=1 Tax=Ensifer sp. WSM1721 TaxID=1041159 RepID=UPI00047D1021|nr:SRPBCC family protein [Ensifer sp. WSM1721]
MKTSEIEHTTFVIERELPGSPRHAFRFWAEPKLKERWTGCHPDWTVLDEKFDFRAGGSEAKRWRTSEGNEQTFNAFYLDIAAEQRIIYAYEMSFRGERISVSLVTIELTPSGAQTHMKLTEQAVFLGGGGARQQRVMGTEEGFDRLIRAIAEETSDAK